jgi:hypothetical protein
MIRVLCLGMVGMVFAADALMAQSLNTPRTLVVAPAAATFEELQRRATLGEVIYVVNLAGQETRGRVVMVSPGSLTLEADGARRQLAAADVGRIEQRRRDSIMNGVLIGAGAGGLAGYGLGKSMDSPNCSGPVECGQGAMVGAVGGAVWGAVGGWLVDTLIRKRETIYLAPGSK